MCDDKLDANGILIPRLSIVENHVLSLNEKLTHCGIVEPYDDRNLDQNRLG